MHVSHEREGQKALRIQALARIKPDHLRWGLIHLALVQLFLSKIKSSITLLPIIKVTLECQASKCIAEIFFLLFIGSKPYRDRQEASRSIKTQVVFSSTRSSSCRES